MSFTHSIKGDTSFISTVYVYKSSSYIRELLIVPYCRLSVYLCGCPTFCGSLVFLIVYLPDCLYVCLSILFYFTIFHFLNFSIYLLVYLSNSLFLCSSICLFVEWSVFSIFLFVCFHSLFFNCLVPMDNISVFN